MSGVNFSPIATPSPAQPRFPTPSPYSFSAASTTWSSRPPIQTANLFLRFLALVLSFGCALSLAAVSTNTKFKNQSSSFFDYPDLLYCFTVNILVFVYAAYQLFKGICDIAHRGILITDKASDYISFIFDQGVLDENSNGKSFGYLLVSASSVAVPTIRQMYTGNALWKASVVSVSMSFALFLVTATSTLFSGYKFCKRIIW